MPRPASHFVNNVRRGARLKTQFREGSTEHVGKPDIENLANFVLNALQGLAYEDDCQVIKISCCKLYDGERICAGRIYIDIKPTFIDLT